MLIITSKSLTCVCSIWPGEGWRFGERTCRGNTARRIGGGRPCVPLVQSASPCPPKGFPFALYPRKPDIYRILFHLNFTLICKHDLIWRNIKFRGGFYISPLQTLYFRQIFCKGQSLSTLKECLYNKRTDLFFGWSPEKVFFIRSVYLNLQRFCLTLRI